MKSVYAKVLLVCLAVSSLDAKALFKPRTHGNFEPHVPRTFDVQRPDQIGETFNVGSPVEAARAYIAVKNNVPLETVRVASEHTSEHNGITHVYLQQVLNGLDVANGVANVNINELGQVISVGNSFYTGPAPVLPLAGEVKLSASEAVSAFAKFLRLPTTKIALREALIGSVNGVPTYVISGASFAIGDIPAELKYIQVEGGSLALVWSIQVEMKDNMYNAMVDAVTGEVTSVMDWVSDASYNVFPIGTNDPEDGERVVITDPAHPVASPTGWHEQRDGETFTDTIGNNVFAQNNPDGGTDYLNNYRPEGGEALSFDFPIDLATDPEDYVDAAVTNLFFWNNAIHDLFYAYGFDEKAGNFQQDNFLRGGIAYDAVIAFAQDGGGTNNANFLTPPDGQHGRMRMYIWDVTNPRRDGDLDGGIVMHEYAHGISTRLTGGPSNVGCLSSGEPGGMGEGWGDFFATVTRTTETSTRADTYAMGDYSAGDELGIRNYVYSTDMTVNPSTYGFLGNAGYTGVHAKGEVWAVILYEVYWNIVEKHGFDPDWFNTNATDVKTTGTFKSFRNGKEQVRLPNPKAALGGNVMAVQLVIDGMKLQPCSPKFVDARDAIIQADAVNYGGENFCELWTAFAKRGLGLNAKAPTSPFIWNGVENFEIPAECATK